MLYTEILQKQIYGPLQVKQIEALDVILNGTWELEGFINNLLDEATQLQAQTAVVHCDEEIEIRSWLARTVKPFQSLAERKGLLLNTAVAETMPVTTATDTESLKLIINNLISNAIKFTDDGNILVNVYPSDEKWWVLEVSDTGLGIAEDVQQQIFEAFWQVDGSATRRVNRGIGLGLSIVKRRVALLGGHVNLKSQPGSGSTFAVVLPLYQNKHE
jgi:two-component system chemotaxis sensor kinase CheA